MSGKSSDKIVDGSLYVSILSCIVYSLMSNVMVLTNRYLVGRQYYGFKEAFFIVAVQAAVAVAVLEIAKYRSWIQYDPFDRTIAKKWAPVSFFFVAMLYTSTQATAGLPIHIVTVFKNVTNIIIVSGEWQLFGEKVGWMVIASLAVMLAGAIMSCYSDIGGRTSESSILGYCWMMINCICTASYVLYMRFVTSKSNLRISKFGMAFYNNLISIPLLLPPMIFNGEAFTLWSNPLLKDLRFDYLLLLSGVLGVGLNLASFWCVSVTSATTYATVGGLNKIPTTFIGVLLLGETLRSDTAIYVTFGMIGGILYGYAKFKEADQRKREKIMQLPSRNLVQKK
ncbi:hypothetical protein ABG067_002460 [Albugo candida]